MSAAATIQHAQSTQFSTVFRPRPAGNGETCQHAKVVDLVWSVSKMKGDPSAHYALYSGDLIMTVTLPGNGVNVRDDVSSRANGGFAVV
jgi:2-keto-4-pentenoate hydratase/2-oxohepta-3-ene-1,7-dioic acid hydratase in catechol pathway